MKKSRNRMLRQAGIVLLFLAVIFLSGAAGAAARSSDRIDTVLKSAGLPEAEQAAVRAKAADAVKAGLPAEDVEIIVERSVNRGMNAGVIARFFDAALTAKKEGAPAGPVLDRIEQGLSKGVPGERIAGAAGRLSGKLVIARPLVDGFARGGLKAESGADRDEAVAGTARALENSISVQSLRALAAAVRERGGTMPLYTVAANTAAFCAANGMSPLTAGRIVRNAVDRGSSGDDLDAMVRRMNDDMKRGAAMNDIAAKMDREAAKPEREKERDSMRENIRPDRGMSGGMGGGPGMGGRGR